MKLLLIVSLTFLIGCDTTIEDRVKIDDYEFYSLKGICIDTKQIDVDVVAKMKHSKKIKGPIKGYVVKNLFLLNKKQEGDTLIVIIFGTDNKYFKIGEDYYQAKSSILSK